MLYFTLTARIIYIFFVAFFSLYTTSYAKNVTPTEKTQLVYASTKDIRDINPHLYAGEMAAQNMVFEPLLIDTQEGLKPCLAERWKVSDDGKEYTFYLRHGVTFTDGQPFNAEAVKKNFEAILQNKTRHAWIELVNELQKIEVIDTYTIKIILKNAYYPTLVELSMVRPFRFISPACFKDQGTKNGVSGYAGTGPWILSEYKNNQYAIFTKNTHYWGASPVLERIKWQVMPDPQTIYFALQAGEVDLLFGSDGDQIDLDTFEFFKKSKKFKTLISHPIASRAILLNAHQPLTKDPILREAIQYAIDKKAIVEGVLNNTETIADTLLSKTLPYCNIDLPPLRYNPKYSLTLLDSAGWKLEKDNFRYKNGKLCQITLYYNTQNAQERSIGEYLQADLKKVGISLILVGEEKQTFLDRQRTGEFDLQYSLSWGPPFDPQSYLSSWRIPAHGDYQAQVGLERKQWIDESIGKVMIEPSEEKRKVLYREILTYIHDSNIYVPISYSRTKAVCSSSLEGVYFPLSQYEIPFASMYFK